MPSLESGCVTGDTPLIPDPEESESIMAHHGDDLNLIGDDYRGALLSMYAGEAQLGDAGRWHSIDDTTRISIEEGLVLFSLGVRGAVHSSLEVGLAYGFSTVFMLAALEQNGGGMHVAIDPLQATDWNGIGITTARRLVTQSAALTSESIVLVEDPSHIVLSDLERTGHSFGLIFIDGYHRFDDVLVDFTLAARMCPVGGTIVLHDMWLNSIAAVASFLRHNRVDFIELETGCENLLVMQRVADDARDWQHFVDFPLR